MTVNYQTRAFRISFLLHSVIIVLVILGSTFLGQYKKAMVLDFDLLKPVPETKKVEELAPTPFINTNLINPIAHQIVKKEEPPPQQEETPRKSSVPEAPPVVKLPEANNLESRPMGAEISDKGKMANEGYPGIAGGTKDGSGTNSSLGNGDGSQESASTKYLNDNYKYIRDKIIKNVSYPDPARRMGWQGKVLLSFVITADGSIRALKVIKSSGFIVLDKSAVESVRDTAPFPKPPGEAPIVIPITYHLE